jgi:hypothetical protein
LVDLTQLIGGKHFTVPCTLSFNGYGVKTLALADSGANGFLFIDTKCAHDLSKYLNLEYEILKTPCPVKGYDGKPGTPVTKVVYLHLSIDGHRQQRVPMLVLDLGNHDLILGRKWFETFDILLDVRRRRLIWPEDRPTVEPGPKELITDRNTLRPQPVQPYHQEDVARRAELFRKEEVRREGGKRSQPTQILSRSRAPAAVRRPIPQQTGQTYARRAQENLRKMDYELKRQYVPKPTHEPPVTYDLPKIDMALIGAAGFDRNLRNKDNVFSSFFIYELDQMIAQKKAEREGQNIDLTDRQLVEQKLLKGYAAFKDVFSKEASNVLPPAREYDHKIELEGTNTIGYSSLRHQSLEELLATKKFLDENLLTGFITASQASYASPILFVQKPNGQLRFCIDFRKLNSITRKDRYPLPLIDETLARIGQAKIFTKLDIRQAFHRIRMNPESENLTTFRTRYGQYKCRVLMEGLTNGPATFQRFINETLFDYLDDFCTAYLDDILIYSTDLLEHELHVKKVLERLRAAGIQADIKKSEFSVKRTKYLGFIISTDSIKVDPDKVRVVTNWKVLTTVKGIQLFLGFCNFYRRFIRDYGRIAKPLNHLTRKDTPFVFDHDCIAAFEELKHRLTTSPVLAHMNPDYQTRLETDASGGVVAGVFSQLQPADGQWHPVAYFSKTMVAVEHNYDIHDKEMLAIILSFEQWRPDL